MNLYILHNVRGLCFYTLWDLLVIGICAIVVPSAKPKRQTDARSLRNVSLLGIFLLFCLQVPGFALFTFRGLLLCEIPKRLRSELRNFERIGKVRGLPLRAV